MVENRQEFPNGNVSWLYTQKKDADERNTMKEIELKKDGIEFMGGTRYKIIPKIIEYDVLCCLPAILITLSWFAWTDNQIKDVIDQANEKYGAELISNRKRRLRILRQIQASLSLPLTTITIVWMISKLDENTSYGIISLSRMFVSIGPIGMFVLVYIIANLYIFLAVFKPYIQKPILEAKRLSLEAKRLSVVNAKS